MTSPGRKLMESRGKALTQVELLAQARQSGTIDDATAAKVEAVLARELEMLRQARTVESAVPQIQQGLLDRYKKGQLRASQESQDAARLIIELEREP